MLLRLAGFLVVTRGIALFSEVLAAAGVPQPVRMVVYAVVAFTALVGSLWYWQESLLYMPSIPDPSNPLAGQKLRRPADGPEGLRSPPERGLEFEDLRLKASDGVTIHAWFIPAAAGRHSAPTLLFSHENAGSMALRLPHLKMLHEQLGCNILCYDYRGYGDSDDATIDEAGLMRDAHAAYRWLVHEGGVDAARIVIYGASLGGAVSIQLAKDLCEGSGGDGGGADDDGSGGGGGGADAALPRPLGVVVCNTFTSIEGMLTAKYGWLDWGFVRAHLLRLRWRSIEHIAHVPLPILFVVGLKDELVPPFHTACLKQAAVSASTIHLREVPDGTHNDTWIKAGPSFARWVNEFIAACGEADVVVDMDKKRK